MADSWSDFQVLDLPGMSFEPSTGVASFTYQLRGATRSLHFTETITLPAGPDSELDQAREQALLRVLELLYVAASTSYYKAAAPALCSSYRRPVRTGAGVGHALYRQGFGEFAYRNNLPHVLDLDRSVPAGRLRCAARAGGAPEPSGRPVAAGCVGGGKDSIVSIEALKAAGFDPGCSRSTRTRSSRR